VHPCVRFEASERAFTTNALIAHAGFNDDVLVSELVSNTFRDRTADQSDDVLRLSGRFYVGDAPIVKLSPVGQACVPNDRRQIIRCVRTEVFRLPLRTHDVVTPVHRNVSSGILNHVSHPHGLGCEGAMREFLIIELRVGQSY
jgi:hypothetical protein